MKNNVTIDGIEILRFVSAFSILVWHYQHFNYPLNSKEMLIGQPFYEYLKIFYNYGYMGVNFFWCISGFIFYWKYGDIVKHLKFSNFFISRFSRLYPLHFITLILVLFLQNLYFSLNQNYFITQNNDFYHFFLHLFFASNWGFEKGMSFNGVIWSVSIEVLVYALFFILLTIFNKNIFINILIVIICLIFKLIYEHLAHNLIDCALFFFIGGFLSFILNFKKFYKKFIKTCSLLFILSLILIINMNLFNFDNLMYIVQIFLYPSLILLSCEIYFNNKYLTRIFKLLGNLTYSSYLLHFPIQIFITIFYLKIDEEIPFNDNLFFLFYISIVLTLSYYSFKYFEDPCKKKIRNLIN